MRNLKRVLSLALASVMVLGMMVMGAGAADTKSADITDIDKVVNKEAVSLLVDLKVITGKPDGSYAPTEVVDRATMSTLIYKIMTGETSADAYKGTGTLKDVAGTWAEGFINYCNSLKIVSGDGTNFYPTNKVTVAQAAKMLLTAIGYDAELSKYQNDSSWSINIMRDAKKAGIMANLASLKATDELTRDSAAQMIYNTLFAEIVKPDVDRDQGVAYLKGYIGQKTSLAEETYSMKSVTAKLTATKAISFDTKKTLKDGQVAVAKAVYDSDGKFSKYADDETVISIAAPSALIGHEVKYFVNADGDVLSTALVATGKTSMTTYTWSATSKDNSDFTADMSFTNTKYSKNYGAAKTGSLSASAGNTVLFINTDGTGAMEYVVVTDSKFDEVLDVNATKGTIKFKVLGTRNIKDIDGATDLVKGDFVITTQMAATYAVKKAESVQGTMTSKTTTKISIDGTSYDFGTDFATDNGKNVTSMKGLAVKDAVAGTYYLDATGKVTVFVPSEEVADTTAKYAYIEALSVKTDEWTHEKTATAKVILADGTRETKELYGPKDTTTLAYAAVQTDADLTALVGAYAYTIKDEKMLVKTAEEVTTAVTANFKTGAPSLKGDRTAPFADDNTVVLFYTPKTDDSAEVLQSYTGVKNIPNFASNKVVASIKDNYAKFVFVSAAPTGAVSDKQYAFSLGEETKYTEVSNGYAYSFVVNGEKKDLVFANILEADKLDANTIYTYTENDKGIASIASITTPVMLTGVVSSVTSDYIIVTVGGTNTTYYLNGDETIDDLTDFSNDGKLTPTTGSLNKGDSIKFFVNDKFELIKAYIVPAPAVESVEITANGNVLTASAVGVSGGKVSYQWSKDNVAINGATESTHDTTGTAGAYKVVVTVTSQLESSVTVTANATFTIPTV